LSNGIVDSRNSHGRPGEYTQKKILARRNSTFKIKSLFYLTVKILLMYCGSPRTKSDITLFREGQKTLTLIKSFKVIKVIKENHQLRLHKKAEERRINSLIEKQKMASARILSNI